MKPKQADILVELAQQAELFHAPDGTTYATVKVAGHRENHALHRKGFRQWLARRYYSTNSTVPGSQAMQDALAVLEAQAQFDGPEIPTFLRLGETEGDIYLDLGDDTWKAVRILGAGWEVVAEAGCRFRRAPGLRPLPLPTRGGDINVLRRFTNVATDDDFYLLVGSILVAYHPTGPYPIVNFQGEQGSTKTTMARMQRELIDPASVPLRTMPRDERDLHIAATNNRLLLFDNVSKLSTWISDALCRLSTGGGFSTRQLYTDQDEVLFDVTRPVILTGIEDVIERDDLRDRAIILTLPPVPDAKRKDELTLWAAFREAQPYILGALLDAVASAIRNLDRVAPSNLPRMADFARWITAAEGRFGWEWETVVTAYKRNRGLAVQQLLDGDRFAIAVMEMTDFTGNSATLLTKLNELVRENDRGPDWPKSPRGASGRLRRLAPSLRGAGFRIAFDGDRRTITISKNGRPINRADRAEGAGNQARLHGPHGPVPDFSNETPAQAERLGLQEGS